ncbi:MAG: outer membrane protein assembly factor BamB family protein [Ktedonobacteraceae bacterium]
MYGFNSQHTGVNPYENTINTANVSRLTLAWVIPTDYPGLSAAQPAVDNGNIYYGSGHTFYAFNTQTGATLWKMTFSGSGDLMDIVSPIVSHGIVYICPGNVGIYAFNARTGDIIWHKKVAMNHPLYEAPTLANGVLYEGMGNGKMYAINAQTGATLWASSSVNDLYAAPAFANGILYVTADIHLYALDAKSGKILWKVDAGGYNNTAPTIVNGVVYVAGGSPDGYYQAYLFAYNAITGKQIWVDDMNNGVPVISSPLSLAVTNSTIYLYSGEIYAFSTKSGTLLWHTNTGNSACEPGSSPVEANGVVYVGACDDQKIYAFDAKTGATLWNYTTDSNIYALPVVVNGMVFVDSIDAKLYAFHL